MDALERIERRVEKGEWRSMRVRRVLYLLVSGVPFLIGECAAWLSLNFVLHARQQSWVQSLVMSGKLPD